jgi:FkbM family methyltransferase
MFRKLSKRLLAALGYELQPLKTGLGKSAWLDARFLMDDSQPVVFDVGANKGQTIREIRRLWPIASIHAFEPSPSTFELLLRDFGSDNCLRLNNVGLGSTPSRLLLQEHSREPYMNSFLASGKDSWSQPDHAVEVEVDTLDAYCTRCGITSVDVLKIDTQGFDLEVLKGGTGILGATHFILTEVTFVELYAGMPPFDQLFRFLIEKGFSLVGMYDFHHQGERAGWADALFVRDS